LNGLFACAEISIFDDEEDGKRRTSQRIEDPFANIGNEAELVIPQLKPLNLGAPVGV